MKVQARLNKYRRSAQKVREIFPVIKGLDVENALLQLEYSKRGDALDIKKLLESAVANATNNFKLNKEELFVENILAEEGKTMKRWRPRAYGRAARILKRTCDVVITLEVKQIVEQEVKESESLKENVSTKEVVKESIVEQAEKKVATKVDTKKTKVVEQTGVEKETAKNSKSKKEDKQVKS